MSRKSFSAFGLMVAVAFALVVAPAFAGDLGGIFKTGLHPVWHAKAALDPTAIYIDSPPSLAPSTTYNFSFRIDFATENTDDWLIQFEITFPAGYVLGTATDPNPVYQQGAWQNAISGQSVTWTFSNAQYPGYGDVPSGYSITFNVTATSDAAATNGFVCNAWGDVGGTLTRTRYVGAPEVKSVSPEPLRVAGLDDEITVEFTKAVEPSSFTYTLSPNPGGTSVTWNGDNTAATISHSSFGKGQAYDVSIGAVEDSNGYAANPAAWTFFTKYEPITSAYAITPPTCDGMIFDDEWKDAPSYDIGVGGGSVKLRVMNDLNHLYLGIDAKSDTQLFFSSMTGNCDQMGLYFDENNDGSWPPEGPSGEGIYWLLYNPDGDIINYRGIYGSVFDNTIGEDADQTLSKGISAAVTNGLGNVQYEFCADFTNSQINVTGTALGILLFVVNAIDMQTYEYIAEFPLNSYSYNPQTFQEIDLAPAPQPAVSGIDPTWGKPNETTAVTITGTYFADGAKAYIGEKELVLVAVPNSTTVTGTVPSGLANGDYDVTVENIDGQKGVLPGGFHVGQDAGDDDSSDDDDDSGSGGSSSDHNKKSGCGC